MAPPNTTQTPAAPRKLGSLEAAAQRYGCSVKTIRRLIAAGELRAYRLGKGRMIRVDFAEADAALLRPIPTTTPGGAA